MCDRLIHNFELFIVLLIVLFPLSPAEGSQYIQVPGVIHVHSTYSSGTQSLPELVRIAESSNVEVLVITDHDWVTMEYGLAPFRRLVKVRKDRPSVIKAGAGRYLDQINTINNQQNDVIVIPGVQSSPFYYWSGNPVTGNLTANDFRKELITIGMSDAADYENLPVLHRVSFSTVRGESLFLCLAAILMFSWGLWRNRPGKRDRLALVLMGLAVFTLVNFHPFTSSFYDPYHGPRGVAPFQNYIDYVQSRGGMTFWSHPESTFSAAGRKLGPIQMKTEPYPEVLSRTRGYTGFAAIYGDTAIAQNPGMHWDEVLFEYRTGLRHRPVWAIAEADYHGTGKDEALDRFQTVFLVKQKTRTDVLDAMAKGRMYAVIKHGPGRPVLDDFRLTNRVTGEVAFSGQQFSCDYIPVISGALSVSDGNRCDTEVLIIRNGKTVKVLKEQTPFTFNFQDRDITPGNTAYRIEARMKGTGKIISNPIFVDRSQDIMTARKDTRT